MTTTTIKARIAPAILAPVMVNETSTNQRVGPSVLVNEKSPQTTQNQGQFLVMF